HRGRAHRSAGGRAARGRTPHRGERPCRRQGLGRRDRRSAAASASPLQPGCRRPAGLTPDRTCCTDLTAAADTPVVSAAAVVYRMHAPPEEESIMRIFTGAAARRTLIGAVAAAATVVVGTTIAAADPGGDDGVGAFLLTSGGEVGAVLCGPDVGVHPDPAGACETIRSAGGDFENLPAEQHTMCTMILQPTPAHAW